MSKADSRTFFLRFYGRSTQEIEQCMRELAQALPQAFTWLETAPDGTVNPQVAMGLIPAPRQVNLTFSSVAERNAAYGDERCKTIYMSWATKIQGATLAARSSGDKAYPTQASMAPGPVGVRIVSARRLGAASEEQPHLRRSPRRG